jgi:hypothetical protein
MLKMRANADAVQGVAREAKTNGALAERRVASR